MGAHGEPSALQGAVAGPIMAELQGLTGPSRQAGSMDIFTAIIASPTVDGVACAVIAARAARGGSETFFLNSASLTEFFRPSIQQKLPGLYSLVICDLELVHTTWDGQLVRPRLLDALRSFVSPALWLSARAWRPEDRAAVENILGPSRLVVSEAAPCTAALVRERFASPDDRYADAMVRFAGASAAGRAGGEAQPRACREGRAPPRAGARGARPPVPVGQWRLVAIEIPPQGHAYWREVSDHARARSGAGGR